MMTPTPESKPGSKQQTSKALNPTFYLVLTYSLHVGVTGYEWWAAGWPASDAIPPMFAA